MLIQAFPSGPFSTNTYVAACPSTKEAVIIDPAPDCFENVQQYLQTHGLKATKILLTHSHWDHIADVSPLKETLNIPVYVHALDAPNLEQPGSDGLPCWIHFPGVKPDHFLQEGDILPVGNLRFQVLHTPGHSPGSVAFYAAEEGVLFSGDTLFKGTIGNLAFPTSQPDFMWKSLDQLAKLPPSTQVYPGHGPSTQIGWESWLPDAKEKFS